MQEIWVGHLQSRRTALEFTGAPPAPTSRYWGQSRSSRFGSRPAWIRRMFESSRRTTPGGSHAAGTPASVIEHPIWRQLQLSSCVSRASSQYWLQYLLPSCREQLHAGCAHLFFSSVMTHLQYDVSSTEDTPRSRTSFTPVRLPNVLARICFGLPRERGEWRLWRGNLALSTPSEAP
jgi:hypothetical protein